MLLAACCPNIHIRLYTSGPCADRCASSKESARSGASASATAGHAKAKKTAQGRAQSRECLTGCARTQGNATQEDRFHVHASPELNTSGRAVKNGTRDMPRYLSNWPRRWRGGRGWTRQSRPCARARRAERSPRALARARPRPMLRPKSRRARLRPQRPSSAPCTRWWRCVARTCGGLGAPVVASTGDSACCSDGPGKKHK